MNPESKSETPRTDATILKLRLEQGDMWAAHIPYFARQLEKELNEANKQIAGYQSACEGWQGRFITENTAKLEAIQERDTLAKQNHQLREALGYCSKDYRWDRVINREVPSDVAKHAQEALAALTEPTNLLVLHRDEVEKWKCGRNSYAATNCCKSNYSFIDINEIKCSKCGKINPGLSIPPCHRCQLLQRMKEGEL